MSITTKEYTERNLLGFEGDLIMREKCRQIIESNEIKTVIETGTFNGGTTRLFSDWVDTVHTIEISQEYFDKSKNYLKDCKNVSIHLGNSGEILPKVISSVAPVKEEGKEKFIKYKPVFFFLDAHFYDFNPLLVELKAISKYYVSPFIAIHDFKVPDHPELGFDSYKGQDYEWSWIEKSIEAIYGKDGYNVEYNTEASGAKRGIIYLSPKNK